MTQAATAARQYFTPLEGADAQLVFRKGQIYAQFFNGPEEVINPISHASALRALSTKDIDTGWQTPGVMRSAETARGALVLSYREPQDATLILDNRTEEPDILTVRLPALVLIGVEAQYRMFALRTTRFSPKDELYNAPLPNVGADGVICFGGNKVPRVTPQVIQDVWELFWAAPFNEHSIQGKSLANLKDIRKTLYEQAERRGPRRAYPVDDLVKFNNGTSVERAWEHLTQYEKIY